jgi:Putative Ig domain
VIVAVLVWLAFGVARTDATTPVDPPVLLIGDSVGTGMSWYAPAIAVMQKNLAVDWQVDVCRRLIGQSCDPGDGEPIPPTLVDLVDTMPSVPPTVVVEMGYNDFQESFSAAVDDAMDSLIAKGARRVLWLTLAATRAPYPALDTILESKLAAYPQLELVDWDRASFNEPTWFQDDLVHLKKAGGVAMAHLIHGAVIALFTPLHPAAKSLVLKAGRPYSAALRAGGGTRPYRWDVASGRPPRGLHLRPDGLLYGRPATRGVFTVSVTDADGVTALERVQTAAR